MKKEFNFYKKIIFISVIVFFIFLILIKSSINLVKSEFINIINSKKFEVLMFNQINRKIESFANKQMTEEDFTFYKDNFKKIYIKFKPIFNQIEKETE